MARMNVTQAPRASTVCVVNGDGSITFQGKRIVVPEVFLEEVIGLGANGFVVKGHHRILSVPLATKFWASLRTKDARDKMAQGIAEVRKLIKAEKYRSVVLWRTAGESEGLFYATMDWFNGQTLESWLKASRPLGLRRLLAYRLVDEVCGMAHDDLYHGDLHTRNVLVDARPASLLDGREPRFAIIDFGTSLFTSRGASRSRHWRVFTQTLDRLVWPFRFRRLAGSFPISSTSISMRAWYRAALASIRHALIRQGAEWLIDAEETHEFYKGEWPNRAAMLSELFPVPRPVLDLTMKLLDDGTLSLTEQGLGSGHLWWPRDRPLDSSTLDGFGPPWSTSITDKAWW